MSLVLKNPHSILSALESRPKDVLQVVLPADSGGVWSSIAQLSRKHGIPTRTGSSKQDQRGSSKEIGGRLGSAEATVREREPVSLEDLFSLQENQGDSGLWIALDSLQDPHNVGSIFRTASFFGVRGILLTQERSASLTATVYDVASGGVESVPFSVQVNLQRSLEAAKEAGLWVLGTSEHASGSYREVKRDRKWLLVLGNEEKGMRRLTQENCDVVCAIPPVGMVKSLNVSVAAGVLISHLS